MPVYQAAVRPPSAKYIVCSGHARSIALKGLRTTGRHSFRRGVERPASHSPGDLP